MGPNKKSNRPVDFKETYTIFPRVKVSSSRHYLATYDAEYKIPCNDFEWEYRHASLDYAFDANGHENALKKAKDVLKKFNEVAPWSKDMKLTLPSNTERLTLTRLLEIANDDILGRPLSNHEVNSKQKY